MRRLEVVVERLEVLGVDPPVVAEALDLDPLDSPSCELSSTCWQVRVAVAGEVRADVRDAAGAERADRVAARRGA